jgi:N-acetylglucosaminyl-diphospho-decaprenol L-rhamnosyltransferase
MSVTKTVTVSIVSHGHGDTIPLLLQDLSQHGAAAIHRVVVTLNIPEPTLLQWITSSSWPFFVRVLQNDRAQGFAANHNQSFAECDTEYFCVMNPDIRLIGNPFPALIERLQDGRVGCAYPLQSDGRGPAKDLAREVPSPRGLFRRYVPWSKSQEAPKHWINGSFMLFPSAVFKAVGGFDERYYMYCEDVDLCLRMHAQGWQIAVATKAIVQHSPRRASHRHWQYFWWHLQSLWMLWHTPHYRAVISKPVRSVWR